MTFKDALKKLNIEDYADRITKSNSRGELFHLVDYIFIAENVKNPELFREDFEDIVKYAEENWKRPESVFQHILKILTQ